MEIVRKIFNGIFECWISLEYWEWIDIICWPKAQERIENCGTGRKESERAQIASEMVGMEDLLENASHIENWMPLDKLGD